MSNAAWTTDEIEKCFDLYRAGYSNQQIAEMTLRSGFAIQAMFQREFAFLGARNPKKYTAGQLLNRPPLLAETRDYMVRAEANAAFLISLLRAGHKPGQGEFIIASEARCVPIQRALDYSPMGSQALSCTGA